jgi:glutamyl-tRNA reductase
VAAFKGRFPASEAVLLSTCNRVELYIARPVHGHPRIEEMVEFLSQVHDVPQETFRQSLYEKSERDVVEHLFNVATSLDSMVLGETQILGQVRSAYESSHDVGATASMLNPLFQRAVAVGKEVIHDTSLTEGRLSVASVAVDYAKQIFDGFEDKTLLCIGAGKMTQLVLQNFAGLSPRKVLVANRNLERAHEIAGPFGGQGVPLDALAQHLVAADIVITSTGSQQPIITTELYASLRRQRRYRPIFLLDIAVPRDVEASVTQFDDVYLRNLDDLQKVVSDTRAQRSGAVESARQIVNRHVDEYVVASRQRDLGPTIDRLYKRLHEVARGEVARTVGKLPNLSAEERQHLDELARRIVNKLLHEPVKALRDADSVHTSSAQYLHAMERQFGMSDESKDQSSDPPAKSTPTRSDHVPPHAVDER